MKKLKKLQKGDSVAILSPSSAAPGKWPHVYELGLERLRKIFQLEPIEYPTTKKIDAATKEKAQDLIDAFEEKDIKAIITSIGGNDQVTYIKNLPALSFVQNPKPFFGFSDNTHFMNFLWLNGIPSYYGGALFTQFAMQGHMDDFTIKYLEFAMFEEGEKEITFSNIYNDIGLAWNDPTALSRRREYEPNEGWFWDGDSSVNRITWGGCLESIDEILRHGLALPSWDQFKNVILMTETSEEVPSSDYVFRVYRALGEKGILERVKGIIVGRPKAWEFNKMLNTKEKYIYRQSQREAITKIVRQYNQHAPIIQNLDFGHTDPQIPMPYGGKIRIDGINKRLFVTF